MTPLRGRLAVLALAALGLSFDAARHVDDSDASLYTVVARHLVQDGTWLELRYLDDVHPQFREHLPFGVWPLAATIHVLGEGALPWVSAVWTLLTIALVIELGARRFSLPAGLLAGLALASTERFIALGAMPRLDPPLLFFSLGACAPFLLERRDGPAFVLTVFATSLACLIKGPFGLVLPATAAVAMTVTSRDWRWLLFGVAACALAVLPVAGFLARADPSWREGYLEHQLLASASGARLDGERGWWFPLFSLGALYWPWLPVPFVGAWLARKDRALAPLAWWSLLGVLALMGSGRKLPHHVVLLFPTLSLLVGATLARLPRTLVGAGVVLACLGAPFAVWFSPPPRAVSCTRFEGPLRALPKGTMVAVVATSDARHWRELATLERDFQLRPRLIGARADAPPGTALILAKGAGDEWSLTPP